jgi:hypothetical protein
MLTSDLVLLVLGGTDRVARSVAAHVARAAHDAEDDRETPGLGDSIDARPAPRAVVLEMRDVLGPVLTAQIAAPVAPRNARVVWLSSGQHHVFDVAIEAAHVVEFERQLESDALRESADIEPPPFEPLERDVGGTWQDPSRYLPFPIPVGWDVAKIDDLGVLTVIVEERLVLELCTLPMPEKVLFVAVRRTMARGSVTDAEVRSVLDRVRNVVHPFRDVGGEGIVKRLFGEARTWVARVDEESVGWPEDDGTPGHSS